MVYALPRPYTHILIMNWRRNTSRDEYIPSYTSPKGGRTACLCQDGKTYSRKCCDGSLQAQGIGSIYGEGVILLESGANLLQENGGNIKL
jgi:hypothetical protein